MDPFTTIALVGNILQFVVYTKNIYKEFNEIRSSTRGLSKNNERIATAANRIHEMANEVANGVASMPGKLNWAEKHIKDVGEEIKKLAENVLADIENQAVRDRSSFSATTKSILKGTWKASAVEKKLKELEELQQRMNQYLTAHIK